TVGIPCVIKVAHRLIRQCARRGRMADPSIVLLLRHIQNSEAIHMIDKTPPKRQRERTATELADSIMNELMPQFTPEAEARRFGKRKPVEDDQGPVEAGNPASGN